MEPLSSNDLLLIPHDGLLPTLGDLDELALVLNNLFCDVRDSPCFWIFYLAGYLDDACVAGDLVLELLFLERAAGPSRKYFLIERQIGIQLHALWEYLCEHLIQIAMLWFWLRRCWWFLNYLLSFVILI